jgi:hypothetical protein
MVNDRIAEVHASGSRRAEVRESVKLRIGTYRGGTSIIDHPPDAPPPETDKPKFYYIIDGVNREATEAAATYLALLQQMVAQFEAAHP